MNLFSLEGKNVVITGANGYLGREMVKGCLKSGAKVLALCRHSELLESSIGENENLEIGFCDVNEESIVAALAERFANRNGSIHGLINNVYAAPRRPSFDMSKEEISEVYQNSYIQYWTTIRALKPYLNPDSSSLINNGSLWAMRSPDLPMYLDLKNEPPLALVSAKAAVHQLTRYLAVIFANEGIRVNTLVPGMFPQKRPPERLDYMEQVSRRIPLNRIGVPEEIIGPVIFLLSEASSYMTGQELIIDGGYTII